jgi:hypothetical protein
MTLRQSLPANPSWFNSITVNGSFRTLAGQNATQRLSISIWLESLSHSASQLKRNRFGQKLAARLVEHRARVGE